MRKKSLKNKRVVREYTTPFRASKEFYLLNKKINYTHKEEMIRQAIDFIKFSDIKGDYFEFGVLEGETFAFAYHQAKNKEVKGMEFYAFDSFKGLPEVKGRDKDFKSFEKGKYKCSLEKFKESLKTKRVNLKKIHIVNGWFDKILNEKLKKKIKTRKAALVWIDCDLYESTVPVLKFITNYLQDGTIIVFDDWFCFKGDPEKGEQKATEEWLKKEKRIKLIPFIKSGWSNNSFIVKIKNKSK